MWKTQDVGIISVQGETVLLFMYLFRALRVPPASPQDLIQGATVGKGFLLNTCISVFSEHLNLFFSLSQ